MVYDRLVAMGFDGSYRTTRRALAEAEDAHAAGRRRVYRPWITEPGCWLQFDWGCGAEIAGRTTLLFCAWLAWSRFRVVIPVWDRTLPTTLSCRTRDRSRRIVVIPTYPLTDNEKTVTTEHIARVPVRHPDIAAAGRHYGTTITTCVPADPESNGRQRGDREDRQGRPRAYDANLRDDYAAFGELRAAAAVWCDEVNTRRHREAGRPPLDMLAEEATRLHPVPADPYVAALGETRVVTRSSVISLGNLRYSVPHQLIDKTVFVRVAGDEVVIAHQGRDGITEVARHVVSRRGRHGWACRTTRR